MVNKKTTTKEMRAFYGQVFRSLRHQSKLTQETLALRAGVTQDLLSKIENGARNFGVDTLFKLLAIYDLQLSARPMPGFDLSAPRFRLHSPTSIVYEEATREWFFCISADYETASYIQAVAGDIANDASRFFRTDTHTGDAVVKILRQDEILPEGLSFRSSRELMEWAFGSNTTIRVGTKGERS